MTFPRIPRKSWTFRRNPKWGDVYWFDFSFPVSGQQSIAYQHPALVVSKTELILPGTLEIIPLPGAEHARSGYAFHVAVTKVECPFLDKDSIVKVDQIFCVLTNPLPDQCYIGTFPMNIMRRVYNPLLKTLGVENLIS